MALAIPDRECTYTVRDTMLYGLGSGFGTDPMDTQELCFVHEDRLRASPTMATVIGWDRSWTPSSGIDWPLVVHGDQSLVVHQPLPPAAAVRTRARVLEILDKGKDRGAVVRVHTKACDATTGAPLWTAISGFFARGDGGFSDATMKGPGFHTVPSRSPDSVLDALTRPEQALLYRLSGDRNPLHAIPAVAQAAGFPRPVLHGLCTYGFACRAVLRAYCALDPARIAEFDARFSSPLFPGETLRVEMWLDGDLVSFRALCVERGKVVLDNGRAKLHAATC